MNAGMLKIVLSAVCSAAITATILGLPNLLVSASAAPVDAPQSQIARNTLVQTTVDLQGAPYTMVVVELILDPGAEISLHQHPGPSLGYVQAGRFSITVPGDGQTSSYSTGGGVVHPWNVPHIMTNSGNQPATMLSFELTPLSR